MAETEAESIKESKETLKIMANDEFKINFQTILRTRYPLFYVTTNEERRFLQFLHHFCNVYGYQCNWWDCFHGIVDLKTKEKKDSGDQSTRDPAQILEIILNEAQPYIKNKKAIEEKREKNIKGIIYVLLDYFRFIEDNPEIERRLKAIAKMDGIISVIMTGPNYKATETLENLIQVIDFPCPNKEEIKTSLYQVVNSVSGHLPNITGETKEMEEDLVNSVSGLTLVEAQTAYSKSIVANKGWNISTILAEKKQIISKSGILEYYDHTVPIEDVGGLEELIKWIKERKTTFTKEAEDYGLKKPRGVLLIGMPGSGKSLTCKAIANVWKMPLLRLDFGKLFGSLVGESENRARDAIKLAENVSPVVLWIDEIEKALSGISSSGRTDGGTTSRVLSTFLTWMQEKVSPVFVVATANDHESIPPEFLRAGRFDEIFFVDLPSLEERKDIFKVLLRLRNYKSDNFDIDTLAAKSDLYSGAEIEKAIDKAMLVGFREKKRKIKTDDITNALSSFKSLYEMRKEDFDSLRTWAIDEGRCVQANTKGKGKLIDMGLDGNRQIDIE